jgi:hypothetical protein
MSEGNTYILTLSLFNAPVQFKGKEGEDKFQPFKEDPTRDKLYEVKNPKTITLGNIAEKSSHIIHTEKTKTKSIPVKHIEGGWPGKDFQDDQREINNWKRRREGDGGQPSVPDKVRKLIKDTEAIIKQNLRIDIYEDYLNDKTNQVKEDNFSANIQTVFQDMFNKDIKRTVNKVCFNWAEPQNFIGAAYRMDKNAKQSDLEKPCVYFSFYI